MSLEDTLYPWLHAYHALPFWVQRAAGNCYRRLPRPWRFGARFEEFNRLAQEGEHWSAAEVQAYQWKELCHTLRHAAGTCAFYQERFRQAGFYPERLNAPDALGACPTLEKRDLQLHLASMISSAVPASRRLYVTTGGSTGVPVGFYLEKGVSRPKEQAFLEAMWRRAGYEPGARLTVIRGQVLSEKVRGPIAGYDATRDWQMLSSYHLTQERLPDYLQAMERFKPDFLHAYPSAALQMAEFLDKAGQSWRLPLRGVLCGSERLTVPQKRLLERVFKTRVYRWYGHSERVVLAGEGKNSELFYFWPQYGYVEFGAPDAEGLCEVIGTSFHNLAMPIIRYRTGDYVRLAESASQDSKEQSDESDAGMESARSIENQKSLLRSPSCGGQAKIKNAPPEYPWPAAVEIAGRAQEYLVSATGRRISLTAFNMHNAVFDHVYAIQFFQEEPGVAELRYVPGPDFKASQLEDMDRQARRKLGEDFRLTFRQVRETEKTAGGKHRWLVSPLAGGAEPREADAKACGATD